MILRECYRLFYIIRILFNYGLNECIPINKLIFPLRIFRIILFWVPNKYPNLTLGKRLCLALQELGPIWIKLGQMLSTRKDIFSSAIINELEVLQNKVKPFDGLLARKYIEQSIGKPLELLFDDFQEIPLASASISQVHTAKLKNGKKIVIKVIRPDVLPIIKTDINLMYRLAVLCEKILINKKKSKYTEIISEYKKNIFEELNLLREMANTMQLRRNFANNSILYIPEVYPDYCSMNIIVMERIYGIPVNNLMALKEQATNMKLLAERGIKIFFIQVFYDSFFHGDMHPGNIFVSYKNPKKPSYIIIDCGIMGSLDKQDKYYLASNFLAFFKHDYRKIAELHIDSGWTPSSTNIEEFEYAIRTVFEPLFEKALKDISLSYILLNLFNTARKFNIEIQPQLILLQKSLLYVEGMVRQLYPKLNLWNTIHPFLEQWIKTQTSFKNILKILKEKTPYWIDKIPELPELTYKIIKDESISQNKIQNIMLKLNIQNTKNIKHNYLLNISVIFIVSGTLLIIKNNIFDNLPYYFIITGFIILIIGYKTIK